MTCPCDVLDTASVTSSGSLGALGLAATTLSAVGTIAQMAFGGLALAVQPKFLLMRVAVTLTYCGILVTRKAMLACYRAMGLTFRQSVEETPANQANSKTRFPGQGDS